MAAQSHRSTMSVSTANLAAPGSSQINKQRRMTSPSLPPPTPLNLPEPVYGYRRPPSPLRNGITMDPDTGEVSEDGSSRHSDDFDNGGQWDQRAQSPSPSVAQFAANFAQRVGSLVSNMSSQRSVNYLPTDAELEAEAERERQKSRREAERILSREAESRRLEERVLAMLEGDRNSPKSLPPPPPIAHATSTPPSPSNSQKEREGWWSIAKTRLTPTKDLTPAQQIIQETKARDKHLEKEKKEIEKEMKKQAKKQEKRKSKEWPASSESKFSDPTFLSLGPPAPTYPARQMSSSPTSPSPLRPVLPVLPGTPPSLAASPLRNNDAGTSSPSRQPPPLYAQFNSQGTLDVPGTLLIIAQRFEKLERWTVGHVRALEERMDDVERWLVEKEKVREKDTAPKAIEGQETGDAPGSEALHELREELAEVQGRIGELGREMAKLVTAPTNLSSGPSRNSALVYRSPSTTSSIAVRSMSDHITTTPRRVTSPNSKEATSPPIVQSVPSSTPRTRLPYPTGDYATPPDSVFISQGPFSPPKSPPTPSSDNNTRRMSIPGLPSQGLESVSNGNSPSGLPGSASPLSGAGSPSGLPAPNLLAMRQSSVSPTPRKRYTVALGGAIMSADRDKERQPTPRTQSGNALFSSSPISLTPPPLDDSDYESDSQFGVNEETIGKSAARSAGLAIPKGRNSHTASSSPTSSPRNSPPNKRSRPQSMYNGPISSNILAPTPTTPLHSRLRSKSTDRFGLGLVDSPAVPITTSAEKFVDPLLIRRQTKEAIASAVPPPPKVMQGKPKVPVGQLVAFFDQGK